MGPDDGFERVLRGEAPETVEEHALGLFLDDVRGAFPTEPPLSEEAHLAAIVEAVQLLADKGEPATRPASKAHGRARHVSGLPKRRRVIVKVPLMRSLTAKVVAGAVVLMSMFGGLAFAGALPGQGSDDDATDVVQTQDVSDETPESEDPDDQGENESEDADDQGENESEDADDQGENESEDADDQGENESEDADDQGENESEDADNQGENESEDADDQGENESEDADDQGENESDQGDDDQGEED